MMYIKRNLEDTILKYLKTPEIIAITGTRQSGKTTLMKHIHANLENSVFISFEDMEIKNLFDNAVKDFISIYIKPYDLIFIDEFQYSKQGGKNLKFIYDTVQKKKIVISGSSVIELTIKAIKYLVGRIFVFQLYPFSFSEFLNYRKSELYNSIKDIAKGGRDISPEINSFTYPYLYEFMKYGGYPRVILCEDNDEKELVLKNIYNTYILRDIRDLTNITDDYKLENLVKVLALQAGNLISYNELCTITGVSFETLKKYIRFFEQTYIIQLVAPFYQNKRTEIVKNPKVYFLDNGLRNSILSDFRDHNLRTDKGVIYENFHFTEMIKKDINLKFWRTKAGAEIDFVFERNNKLIATEIKSNFNKFSVPRMLYNFIEKYHPDKIIIFNDSITGKKDNIYFYPHWMNEALEY